MAHRVYVRRGGTATDGAAVVLDAASNLITGERRFLDTYGSVSTLEKDLLLLASAVFAADRCIARGEREDFQRRIDISIPAVNVGILQAHEARIAEILRTLSNDSWQVHFRQVKGTPEEKLEVQSAEGTTLLFSGGLDSFAAALEFGTASSHLQLVSHMTHNQKVNAAQDNLSSTLDAMSIHLPHIKFQVTSRIVEWAPDLKFDVESSQRTRSFLFLVLAALCARRAGHRKIIMIAENGQMAIHLPLTTARIGAFSTHTAHPDVLTMMQEFLAAILQYPLRIFNPYVYKTKAEVVSTIWNARREAIPITTSCWRNARLPGEISHCGICIPCLVRRISVEYHGADETAYARDLLKENVTNLPPEDDGRRNLADLTEFMLVVEKSSDQEMVDLWPELYSDSLDAAQTIAMYKRAALQAKVVLSKYPSVTPFLQ